MHLENLDNPRLTLTIREAAALAGIGLNSMYEAVRRGDFPSLRISRRLLIPKAAFERILAGEPVGRNS